jgi:hypothetical protein
LTQLRSDVAYMEFVYETNVFSAFLSFSIVNLLSRSPRLAAFTVFSLTPAVLAQARIDTRRPSDERRGSATSRAVSFGVYSSTFELRLLMSSPCSQWRSVSFPM